MTSWFDAGNWSAGVPNGPGHVAQLSLIPGAVTTVTIADPVTLEQLVIGGRGSATISGAGPLTFSNDGSGDLRLVLGPVAGELNVEINAPLGWTATETLHVDVPQQSSLSLGGPIQAAGDMLKTGAGTMRLVGAHAAWNGDLVVEGGVVVAGHAQALGSAAGTTAIRAGGRLVVEHSNTEPLHIDGGAVQLANKDLNGSIDLSASALIHRPRNPVIVHPQLGELEQPIGPANIYGAISGDGDLTIQNQSVDAMFLRGNNSYSGHTYISSGTVNATTATALGSSSEGTTIAGGNLVVQAATAEQFRVESGSLRFSNASAVPSGAVVVAGGDVHFPSTPVVNTPILLDGGNAGINGSSSATSFVGGVAGIDNLRVVGLSVDAPLAHHGDLTISNSKLNVANTYSGKTTVAGDTDVNHSGALGQSQIVRMTAGTLRMNALPAGVLQYNVEGGTLLFNDASQPVQSSITLGGPTNATLSGQGIFQGAINVAVGLRNRISKGVFNGTIGGEGAVELAGPIQLNSANTLHGHVAVVLGDVVVNHAEALPANLTSVAGGTLHFNVPVKGHVLTNQELSESGTVAFEVEQEIDLPWVLNGGALAVNAHTQMERLIAIGGTQSAAVKGSGPLYIQGELTNLFDARLEGTTAGAGNIRSVGSHLEVESNLASFTGKMIAERGDVTVHPAAANSMKGEFHVTAEGTLSFFGDQFTDDIVVAADVYLHNAQGDAFGNQGGLHHSSSGSTARFLGRIDVGSEESTTYGNFTVEGRLVGSSLTHRGSGLRITSPQTELTGTLRVEGGSINLSDTGSLHGLETIRVENRSDLRVQFTTGAPQDRIGDDVVVEMRGGRIIFDLPTVAETIGMLRIERAAATLLAFQEAPLTVEHLERSPGTILQLSLHAGPGGVRLPNVPLQFNGMVGAWAVTETGFATLNGEGAFSTLATTTTGFAGATQNDHVRLNAGVTLMADTTVASITSQGNSEPIDLNGHLLRVASGGLFGVPDMSNGALTAGVGASPSELVIHRGSLIAANIQDNPSGGSVGLVVREGHPRLSGHNSYTGGTWIISSEDQTNAYQTGRLRILSYDAVPANDRVHVDGGVYELLDLPAGVLNLSELHVRQGGMVRGGLAQIDVDNIYLENGQLYATLVGDGAMIKHTDGVIDFSNSTSPGYTGEVTVEEGRLLLQPGTLPQASFVLTGGVVDFSGTAVMANHFTLDGGGLRGGRHTGVVDVVGDSILYHNDSTQLSGTLRGSGNLTIRGRQNDRFTSDVRLSGNATEYHGDLTVESGALRIAGPDSAGSGDITVRRAGRLILGNTNFTRPALQVANDVILDGGTLSSFFASSSFGAPEAPPSVLNGDLTVRGEGFIGSISTGIKNGVRLPGLTLAGRVTLEDGAQVFGLSDGRHSVHKGETALVEMAGQLAVGEATSWRLLSSSVSISGEIRALGNVGSIDFVSIPGQLRWQGAQIIAAAGQTLSVTVNGGASPLSLVGAGSTLAGNGTLAGDYTVGAGASVAPGASTGILTIDGNLSILSGGSLQIELGGLAPGSGYDQLRITQHAALEGARLELSHVDGFVPQVNEVFTVLSANSLVGSFANSHGLNSIANGWRVDWALSTHNGDILARALSVRRQGDFDANGFVDSLDLASWRSNYGASGLVSHSQGDADGNGRVDGRDFLIWQQQLGSGVLASSGTPVPEPACAVLIAWIFGLAITHRRLCE